MTPMVRGAPMRPVGRSWYIYKDIMSLRSTAFSKKTRFILLNMIQGYSRTVSYLTAHKATTKCKQWIKHNSFGACLISLPPKKNLSSIHSFQAFLPQQLKTSRSNQITHWALNLAIDMLGVGVRFWQVAGWKCLNWILHADSNSGSGETRFNRVKCENE